MTNSLQIDKYLVSRGDKLVPSVLGELKINEL